MNLKSIVFFIATVLVVFSSCTDPDAPILSNAEIGDNNSMTATIGGDLHIDVEIVAEGTIDKITIDLHPEGFTADDIEAEYTTYSGQKNADFHEDLAIPATAVAGEYHFHMTVVDQEGQSTSIDADVDIQ